jgi:hypothetical protein
MANAIGCVPDSTAITLLLLYMLRVSIQVMKPLTLNTGWNSSAGLASAKCFGGHRLKLPAVAGPQ